MIELGQLEEFHDDFAARRTKIVAISPDNLEETQKMQKQFPHLTLVSDAEQSVAKATDVLGPHHDPNGQLTNSPTMIFVNRDGTARWIHRPDRYVTRIPAAEALVKVDELAQTP